MAAALTLSPPTRGGFATPAFVVALEAGRGDAAGLGDDVAAPSFGAASFVPLVLAAAAFLIVGADPASFFARAASSKAFDEVRPPEASVFGPLAEAAVAVGGLLWSGFCSPVDAVVEGGAEPCVGIGRLSDADCTGEVAAPKEGGGVLSPCEVCGGGVLRP